MGAYPIEHVPTRLKTIAEIRVYIVKELEEIDRAIQYSGGQSIELVAERNILARVLKFLSNMS